MDYEKEYKEALERARQFSEKPYLEDSKGIVDYIFPELKESEDEKIRKAIKYGLDHVFTNNTTIFGVTKEQCLAWLEKQGEQKSADKIEPKFHEDDWVFIEEVEGYKNGPFQIKTVDSFGYSFDEYHTIPFMYEDLLSNWTIQDASDGDVLVASDGSIFLFAGVVDCTCKYYVALTTDGVININEGLIHYWETSKSVHPATKEQRDLLFQKLKEAEYSFDFEKKELKKIEQNHAEDSCKNSDDITTEEKDRTEYKKGFECGKQRVLKYPEDFGLCKTLTTWSEEDEDMIQALNACINTVIRSGMNYISFDSKSILIEKVKNWLKSLKDRVLSQPKQEWGEEDEDILDGIIEDIEVLKEEERNKDVKAAYQREIDWLKSIKERCTWKPSDEQMKALDEARSLANNCGEESAFDLRTLHEQLKKLREEVKND